jgi:polyhydroxyalkanoate synthesis regulator phasin
MKVFLGWSGDTSKKVALALHGWLPKVLQSVKPYISSEDIAKGARWASEIAKELQASNYGIICITAENSNSPWINFEGGALSREIEKSYVTPFLFNLKPSQVLGPLALFQSVMNEKEEIWKLLESINGKQEIGQRLELGMLKEAFEMWWPKLKTDLAKVAEEEGKEAKQPKRETHEIVEELLTRSQIQQRQTDARWSDYTARLEINLQDQTNRIAQLTGLVTALANRVDALRVETDTISAVVAPKMPYGILRADSPGLRIIGSGVLPNNLSELFEHHQQSRTGAPNLVVSGDSESASPSEDKK